MSQQAMHAGKVTSVSVVPSLPRRPSPVFHHGRCLEHWHLRSGFWVAKVGPMPRRDTIHTPHLSPKIPGIGGSPTGTDPCQQVSRDSVEPPSDPTKFWQLVIGVFGSVNFFGLQVAVAVRNKTFGLPRRCKAQSLRNTHSRYLPENASHIR